MIQDIHAHTYYSNCGRDEPTVVLDAAIAGGVEQFGFCDHNYGIGARVGEYLSLLRALSGQYADRIDLRAGIEVATVPGLFLPDGEDISGFDYCLVEHIDHPDSAVGLEIFAFPDRWGVKTGVAHTDLFALCEANGLSPAMFFGALANKGIFWEMNVSYDSIHNYREHEYVKRFMKSERQIQIVRDSGVELSVGFDGHRVEDYAPERVKAMCAFLDAEKLPMVRFPKAGA